jgi:hypothetical protein
VFADGKTARHGIDACDSYKDGRSQEHNVFSTRYKTTTMDKLKSLRQRIILHPAPGSFTAEGESARWSNEDLDPVPQENKLWEWYHVGGFWVAEGFNVAFRLSTVSCSCGVEELTPEC